MASLVRKRRFLRLIGLIFVIAAAVVTILVVTGRGGFDYDDPFETFPADQPRGSAGSVPGAPDPGRRLLGFVSFVAGDVQGFWRREFERGGRDYQPAQVVAFRSAVRSRCGLASDGTGPFYCPLDRRVYLDMPFFRILAVEFGAPGDFVQAYVVAHELGHHVQTITGVTAQVMEATASEPAAAHDLSIRLELQADCLAGVWGHSTYERGLLERGDLDEGLRAAAAVGDDVVQARARGRIDPETWTHGSSEQRRNWFLRGFLSGDPSGCDTFSVAEP
jgi:uncharacterized protein